MENQNMDEEPPPSKYKQIGTLVDRAISMPYAKPQALWRGCRVTYDKTPDVPIPNDIADSADFVVSTLSVDQGKAKADWSPARLAIDPAGPWWSGPVDDFYQLTPKDRQWILKRIQASAGIVADQLFESAKEERWTWLWSQPSLVKPGTVRRPRITRPDLVVGLSGEECMLVDLKVTTDELSRVKYSEGSFDTWTAAIRGMGFIVNERWVLAADANGENKPQWIQV
jgi:hypothetical protein